MLVEQAALVNVQFVYALPTDFLSEVPFAVYQKEWPNQATQRYRCNYCWRQFILDYDYQGCRPEVRRLIVLMTVYDSGVRDICGVLSISINTVLKTLRQATRQVNELRLPSRITDLQVGETWSFIGNKEQQHLLWYGFDLGHQAGWGLRLRAAH